MQGDYKLETSRSRIGRHTVLQELPFDWSALFNIRDMQNHIELSCIVDEQKDRDDPTSGDGGTGTHQVLFSPRFAQITRTTCKGDGKKLGDLVEQAA